MHNAQDYKSGIKNTFPDSKVKAELLSHGLELTEQFIDAYGEPFLEKRRAYGNSDPIEYKNITVPQELYLQPSKVVCSVNIRPGSIWVLDFFDNKFMLTGPNNFCCEISFPLRPNFYNFSLSSGVEAKSIATLYGGGALGIFIYGTCALVEKKQACKYCSIEPNRKGQTEFAQVIKPEQVYEVVKLAFSTDESVATQVMINGGNFKDSDRSFSYYIDVCRAAREALDEVNSNAELHLIAYPPQDHGLFNELAQYDVSLAMNLEVFDIEKFNFYCPGKRQKDIISALKSASEILGYGKVFSIFVGGLESLQTMNEGFSLLSKFGITPIVNIFHPDPGTELESYNPPSSEEITAMGLLLQKLYSDNSFMRPFYSGCGRNAIDTEAYARLFS